MNERRALILYFSASLAVELLILLGLPAVGADTEQVASTVVLWACAAAFALGGIVTHYHQ